MMCSLIKQDKTKNGALPLPVFLAFFSLVTTASGFSNSFIPAFLVSLQLPGYMFGLVYAIASFMIFILSPFWGKLSERIGRTRVIAAGCLGAACGQALFCTATGAPQIIFARGVTGFFAGGFLVGCLSYGGDLCNLRGSSVPMACSAVVEGTSGAFAYLFGGLAAYRSIRLGFVCQIGLYLTAGLYALLAMPETRQPEKKTGGRWPVREANPFLSLVRLRHIEPWQTAVFWSILIAACGGWMFESAFNYSISAFFSFSPLFNGVLKCGVGILNALVGAGVIRRLVRRGTIRGPLLLVGVLCMAASLLSACSTDRAILFFPFSVCFLLINSLNLPLHQALLTTNKANLPVGELMGLFNAFRSIGQVVGSMVSGFSYTVGHALPFFCASAFFMMMVFILRWGTSGERKRHANGGIKRRKKNG